MLNLKIRALEQMGQFIVEVARADTRLDNISTFATLLVTMQMPTPPPKPFQIVNSVVTVDYNSLRMDVDLRDPAQVARAREALKLAVPWWLGGLLVDLADAWVVSRQKPDARPLG
jgi:hypothetical protein